MGNAVYLSFCTPWGFSYALSFIVWDKLHPPLSHVKLLYPAIQASIICQSHQDSCLELLRWIDRKRPSLIFGVHSYIVFNYTLIFRHSPIGAVPELLILNNLNPISIRIQDKGDVLHAAIRKSLLPVYLLILKALAGSIKIINRDAYNRSVP
jgi:hypothetical protein